MNSHHSAYAQGNANVLIQDIIHVQTVSAVALRAARAFLVGAAPVIPDNADRPSATNPLHKSVAVPGMPVSKDKIASMEVVAAAERSNVALPVATTQIPQFAAEALDGIARKGMIACQKVDAVHPVRSAAVIVNAITLEQRPVAPDLGLSGVVQRVTSVVRMDHAPTLRRKSVVRMALV
ncbi:hypothetical protein ACHAP5_003182 [Fusarium lateritium]